MVNQATANGKENTEIVMGPTEKDKEMEADNDTCLLEAENHEQSAEHLKATVGFSRRLKAVGHVDTELTQQVEHLEHYWRSVLKRVIIIIHFIAERGLAFRGDNELVGSPRNGNFLGIFELISQYNDFLACHIKSESNPGNGHTKYLSSTVMEEVISIMGEQLLREIISRNGALKNNDSSLTFKRVTTTRWSNKSDVTKTLKQDYEQIKEVLKHIVDDIKEKRCVRCEPEGLLKHMIQLEKGIYITFWNDILQRIDATNKTCKT
ncbi:uncharacterized protein [Palaemon carinicauda]|uniref:uncharacterized protein n=1 Tax=Palaemon carinicauda TaxID=392227 RepID=UPI0035B639A4